MAQPLGAPYSYFADSNGAPLAGGKVYTYAAGTTTPQNSYTDSSGTTPAPNPVVLDSAGRATIWLSGFYKIVVTDALGNTISTTDNITAINSTGDMSKSVYDQANIQEQLVGLTAVQTLTNKTLTSPILNTATLNNPTMVTPTLGVASSTSIKFGSGSVLNTYVQGSWTPVLSFGGASVGITYGSQVGTYNQIGNMVFVTFSLTITSKGSSTGAALISGLPVAASTNSAGKLVLNANGSSWPNNAYILTNSTTLLLRADSTTGITQIVDTNFTNTTNIFGSCVYNS